MKFDVPIEYASLLLSRIHILLIILGILLLVNPTGALLTVCRIAGCILLLSGAVLIAVFLSRKGWESGSVWDVALCVLGAVSYTHLDVYKRQVDTVVIAGMGGRLIARILEEGRQVCESLRELVLGPQSEVYGVRTWLEMNDFRIDREDMVLEDGKYYPVIHAVPAEGGKPGRNMAEPGGKILTEEERLFGPCLLKERHPVLQRYLLREEALRKSLTER